MDDDLISRQAAIDAIYGCYISGKEAIKNAPISDIQGQMNIFDYLGDET